MARKSAALRLSQSQELHTAYTTAGLADTRGGRFIRDMISRLERGKGLSKRMRDWLDNLIEDGVPQPKGDPAVIALIDAAVLGWSDNVDRNWESGVLGDFRGKMVMGWDLSEKQTALLDKLLKRAEDDASGANLFTPTPEQYSDLEALVKLYNGYAPQWRAERPAVAKAIHRVKNYLAGEVSVEEYHYNKLYKAMAAKLRKFRTPRFAGGAMGWVTLFNEGTALRATSYKDTGERTLCTAITEAYIDDRGEIVNDWLLHTGEVHTIGQDRIGKRRG